MVSFLQMRHENEHLKSLVTLVYLVKKDASVFPKVLDALDVTQNENFAKIIRDANADAGLPIYEK